MKSKIIAVDIGTSSIKAGILDSSGKLLGLRRAAYSESGGTVYNWKSEYWVAALKKALSGLTRLGEAEAVVFSGSGPTVVPVDNTGRYMNESLLWLDNRKTDIPGEKSFFLPEILWFMQNREKLYQKTSCFLPLSGFFPYLLTGELKAPVPNNRFSGYLWTEKSAKKAGIDTGKLPPFVLTGELIGHVSGKGERKFLIRKGTPVFAGANDYLMALLGTGAVFEGAVCDRAGTSEGINYCTGKVPDCESLRTLPHIIDGFYNVSGVLSSSGKIFEWFRKISGREKKTYITLVKEISKAIFNHDHLYFLPSLKRNSVWDFSGGAFVGLEEKHGIAETGSAVLKSIGFSVRDIIQLMESCSLEIDEIRLSGGQSKNPPWNQIKSDITGKKLLVPAIEDGELLGCACSEFKGMGYFSSLSEASESLVRIKEVYRPDPKAFEKYSRLFREYAEISRKMDAVSDILRKQD